MHCVAICRHLVLHSIKNTKAIMNSNLNSQTDAISKITTGKRILFATVPAEGHVNPLTGMAVYLKTLGYEVRYGRFICKAIANCK